MQIVMHFSQHMNLQLYLSSIRIFYPWLIFALHIFLDTICGVFAGIFDKLYFKLLNTICAFPFFLICVIKYSSFSIYFINFVGGFQTFFLWHYEILIRSNPLYCISMRKYLLFYNARNSYFIQKKVFFTK